ncbi:hypothetical protein P886_3785 [Alteromonadaceae bacterium 2753L.S.0a.02]|nr:hypothetical protein P886_3785 [Alteromonadaceae bacterium 2753L.S.0a.02]
MAMNASALAEEMVTQLQSKGFVTTNEFAKTQEMCEALATAIVNHITSNAETTPGGATTHTHQIT